MYFMHTFLLIHLHIDKIFHKFILIMRAHAEIKHNNDDVREFLNNQLEEVSLI